MKKVYACILVLVMLFLCGCQTKKTASYTGEIPELRFSHTTKNEDGKKCFYLFDDNPEHLKEDFLADGENPSSIAHFGNLEPGVYTVFSYHHRGSAAEGNEDLFFDVLFRGDGEFKVTRLGLDHDWNWNKVWADYSGVDVFAPEIINSFNCSCFGKFCAKENSECDENCGCAAIDVLTQAEPERFSGLNEIVTSKSGENLLLSRIIPNVGNDRINEIRHGGYNEPIWLMMEFEILSGELSVDTVAYKSMENCDFNAMKKGKVADEPQFKGIAESAPEVTVELEYSFDDSTDAGTLPIKIFNQKYPDGYVAKDGAFATCVNTWKDTSFISAQSAESDMMHLTYRDEEKFKLFGENAQEKTDVWYFDPFHTRLYENKEDKNFVPNISMAEVAYPVGESKNEQDFYKEYVLNLGNFGVRYIYHFTLKNQGSKVKTFVFSLNSVSGQVYRYTFRKGNEVIRDDGGKYIVKKYDNDPAEKPFSHKRREPAKYTTSEEFILDAGEEYSLTFEVVTLTGCKAPMTNILSVK